MVVAVVGLVAVSSSAFAAPKENKQNPHQQGGNKGGDKPNHGQQKHVSGKDLLGDKVKTNGKHKLEDHGKFSAFANVSNGKITGVNVRHSEKGDVHVTKYKSNTKMAQRPTSGIMLASRFLAQSQYVGTTYIGYAYIDDYGDEVIYWFPYDMILDGDTVAIDYVPA
jgi:hypothetical protein